jgi:hypothetical protein
MLVHRDWCLIYINIYKMKVLSKKIITLDEGIDVYDIEVNHSCHNFLLACNVFVHNCCGDSCHDSNLAEGSPTVFVNGKEMARIGDPVACGSAVIEGSLNVFCGG